MEKRSPNEMPHLDLDLRNKQGNLNKVGEHFQGYFSYFI